jgi:hypothetical protein
MGIHRDLESVRFLLKCVKAAIKFVAIWEGKFADGFDLIVEIFDARCLL